MNYLDYASAVKKARGYFGPNVTLVCQLSAENFEKIYQELKQPGQSKEKAGIPVVDNVIFRIRPRPDIGFSALDSYQAPAHT